MALPCLRAASTGIAEPVWSIKSYMLEVSKIAGAFCAGTRKSHDVAACKMTTLTGLFAMQGDVLSGNAKGRGSAGCLAIRSW